MKKAKWTRRAFAATMMTCVMTSAAQAQVGCWDETQTAAAKVRNLQNRLLVATQLCAITGRDISPTYNAFVRVNRATIQGANGVLRAQFTVAFGRDGERHYDAFVTGQVNAFGSSQSDEATCLAAERAAAEGVAAEGDVEKLLDLHDRLTERPVLPGGRCPIRFGPAPARVAAAATTVTLEVVDAPDQRAEVAPALIDRAAVIETAPAAAAAVVIPASSQPAVRVQARPDPVQPHAPIQD